MIKLRIFVSSVQKELADERRAVKTLVTSDPFLDEHCVPILYEDEPSMLKPASEAIINVMSHRNYEDACGAVNPQLSATHSKSIRNRLYGLITGVSAIIRNRGRLNPQPPRPFKHIGHVKGEFAAARFFEIPAEAIKGD